MSTATHTSNGHATARGLELPARSRAEVTRTAAAEHLELGLTFTETVLRYLLLVAPVVRSELTHWQHHAERIPNPVLRGHALQSLSKRGNMEGAALFAVLAPSAQRRRTVRALVAYQAAYNYLDTLSEQPSADPQRNTRELHQALITALLPGAEHPDYYRHNPDRADGGYLLALIDACRDSLVTLPCYLAIASTAIAATHRIVDFQSLNLAVRHGGHTGLQAWAEQQTPPGSGLRWWEVAAGAGSSLAVHAMIAAAAGDHVHPSDARDLDRTYFPWAGGLHSLLDSLVDRREDHDSGHRCLLDYYHSNAETTVRLGHLARRAREATRRLVDPVPHRVILTAMCSYYLSAPECDTAQSKSVTSGLTQALGLPLSVAVAMFRVKRLAGALSDNVYT
jgi:tetraprenyl-beta-curcumene synthase